MKNYIIHFFIISIFLCLFSCSAKDDPNELINTQFATEIVDSCHILSPKTYSYLHNIQPPLGVKPVVVVVDNISDSQMGTFADKQFDKFSEKKYSGNTFKSRGILIVASKKPELVQVRVGKTYAAFCRMRGSAAGAYYLNMQNETSSRGINEMCPIALKNVINDIEDCRQLPWYKKIALKVSFVHLEMFMDDIATPSESFFSQFYFRPFLYIVGLIRSLFGSWILAFLFIAVFYTITKNWIDEKLEEFIRKRAEKDSHDDKDFVDTYNIYFNLKNILVFLIKLVITLPTLAAISLLSTARMEDIIALHYAHIPSVELISNYTKWSNTSPEFMLILLVIVIYYLKFLLCDKGLFTIGQLSDRSQLSFYNNEKIKNFFDSAIKLGYNRAYIQKIFKILFNILALIPAFHNFHEIDFDTTTQDTNDLDNDSKPQKRLVDFLFHDEDSDIYRQSPAFALLVNVHREALYLTAFVGLAVAIVFSYTYAIYFLTLWTVQLFIRVFTEYRIAHKLYNNYLSEFNPYRLIKHVWKTDVVFLLSISGLILILTTSYTSKSFEAVEAVQHALPDDFSGMYFVPVADGQKAQGVTARIIKEDANNYNMMLYSDMPTRNVRLQLDESEGLFHSDFWGDGYIIYDEQTKSININFSDLWVLTN